MDILGEVLKIKPAMKAAGMHANKVKTNWKVTVGWRMTDGWRVVGYSLGSTFTGVVRDDASLRTNQRPSTSY